MASAAAAAAAGQGGISGREAAAHLLPGLLFCNTTRWLPGKPQEQEQEQEQGAGAGAAHLQLSAP